MPYHQCLRRQRIPRPYIVGDMKVGSSKRLFPHSFTPVPHVSMDVALVHNSEVLIFVREIHQKVRYRGNWRCAPRRKALAKGYTGRQVCSKVTDLQTCSHHEIMTVVEKIGLQCKDCEMDGSWVRQEFVSQPPSHRVHELNRLRDEYLILPISLP